MIFDKLKSVRDEFFRVPQGKCCVRILPPRKKGGKFIIKAGIHLVELDEGGLNGVGYYPIPCPISFDDEVKCVLCNRARRLEMSRDKDDWLLAERLVVLPRYYANVVAPGEVLKVWHFGLSVYRQIMDCERRYGDISDPKKGRNLVVTREGHYKESRYRVGARKSPSALPAAILAQLEEDPSCLKSLRKLCKLLSDEEVEEAYEFLYKDWCRTMHAPIDELREVARVLREDEAPLESDWDK